MSDSDFHSKSRSAPSIPCSLNTAMIACPGRLCSYHPRSRRALKQRSPWQSRARPRSYSQHRHKPRLQRSHRTSQARGAALLRHRQRPLAHAPAKRAPSTSPFSRAIRHPLQEPPSPPKPGTPTSAKLKRRRSRNNPNADCLRFRVPPQAKPFPSLPPPLPLSPSHSRFFLRVGSFLSTRLSSSLCPLCSLRPLCSCLFFSTSFPPVFFPPISRLATLLQK